MIASNSNNPQVLTTEPQMDSLITILTTVQYKYLYLYNLCAKRNLTPSTILMPQSLNHLNEVINFDNDFIYEALNYLDFVKLMSITVYGSSQSFTDEIIRMIVSNRTVHKQDEVLGLSALEEFIFNDPVKLESFLLNNPIVLAVYIYALTLLVDDSIAEKNI